MFVRIALSVFTLLAISGSSSIAQQTDPCARCPNLAPADPWDSLAKGNDRFVKPPLQSRDDGCRRTCTEKTQKPYAIVLSCSDSRVPPEIAFDQRLGDIFVVRVAGNVATDEAIGSIEYALDHLKTPKLIVVLGHQRCGAVEAALALKPTPDLVPSILNRIFPAISGMPPGGTDEARLKLAVERNIRYTVRLLPAYSEVIAHAVKGGVKITGAYYSVETGRVTVVNP